MCQLAHGGGGLVVVALPQGADDEREAVAAQRICTSSKQPTQSPPSRGQHTRLSMLVYHIIALVLAAFSTHTDYDQCDIVPAWQHLGDLCTVRSAVFFASDS
jgi:hypothetical protein